jgi:segregation and condensation protein B
MSNAFSSGPDEEPQDVVEDVVEDVERTPAEGIDLVPLSIDNEAPPDSEATGDSEADLKFSDALPGEGETGGEVAGLPETVLEGALAGIVPESPTLSLARVIEAILFASQKAATPKELVVHLKNAAAAEPNSDAAAFSRVREADVREALQELQAEVAASGRAYSVRETASGWLLSSAPGFAPWLRALYPEAKPTRLSAPALETLAIIAYRQPLTRADIEAVRGVAVDGVMQTLLDRGLVKIAGRAEVAGRPLLYSTTQFFLDHFGLRHLEELPNAAELRQIPLPSASSEKPKSEPDVRVANGGTMELPQVAEVVAEAPEPTPQEVAANETDSRDPDEPPLSPASSARGH